MYSSYIIKKILLEIVCGKVKMINKNSRYLKYLFISSMSMFMFKF